TARDFPDAAAIDDGELSLTYSQLLAVVRRGAERLYAAGVRRGGRVGIRMPSGSRDLYVTILATLYAGAAYVPVDADDPDERAELVFGEAQVDAIVGAAGIQALEAPADARIEPSPLAS
ncbi:amino acid adenylation domain-containing protein, partial [Streptomyces sp. SID10244]|nr:amino acid adenylation domain-containing protein [Streptomyces sp. SID10244]